MKKNYILVAVIVILVVVVVYLTFSKKSTPSEESVITATTSVSVQEGSPKSELSQPRPFTVTFPLAGSQLQIGETYDLTWVGSDLGINSYAVYLTQQFGNLSQIRISGEPLHLGTAYPKADFSGGKFSWKIPSSIKPGNYIISFGAGGNGGGSRVFLVDQGLNDQKPVTIWSIINDTVNKLSFKYPDSLAPTCATLQQRPEVIATLVKDAKVGPDGCYPTLNGSLKRDNITLGGRDFCYSVSSDVGAGQLYYEYLYTTLKDDKYYTLRYVVHTSNGCGAYMNSNDPNSPDNARYRECVSCQAKYDDVVIPLIKESVASLKFTN
jgi:hypothetical protein